MINDADAENQKELQFEGLSLNEMKRAYLELRVENNTLRVKLHNLRSENAELRLDQTRMAKEVMMLKRASKTHMDKAQAAEKQSMDDLKQI